MSTINISVIITSRIYFAVLYRAVVEKGSETAKYCARMSIVKWV